MKKTLLIISISLSIIACNNAEQQKESKVEVINEIIETDTINEIDTNSVVSIQDTIQDIIYPEWDCPIQELFEGQIVLEEFNSTSKLTKEEINSTVQKFKNDTFISNGNTLLTADMIKGAKHKSIDCSEIIIINTIQIEGDVLVPKKNFANGSFQQLIREPYFNDTIFNMNEDDLKHGKIKYGYSNTNNIVIAERNNYKEVPYTDEELKKWEAEVIKAHTHNGKVSDYGNTIEYGPEVRIGGDLSEFRIARKVNGIWKTTGWQKTIKGIANSCYADGNQIRLIVSGTQDEEEAYSQYSANVLLDFTNDTMKCEIGRRQWATPILECYGQ